MSVNKIPTELCVDLSTEKQQLISGGKKGTIDTQGEFVYGNKTFPATIQITVKNLPKLENDEHEQN